MKAILPSLRSTIEYQGKALDGQEKFSLSAGVYVRPSFIQVNDNESTAILNTFSFIRMIETKAFTSMKGKSMVKFGR